MAKAKKEQRLADDEEYIVANVEPGDWFCMECHSYFGRPVYDAADETMVWLCPVCHCAVVG